MSAGLPKRFDPQHLAAQGGGALEGRTDTSVMPRLRDMLATDATIPVDFEVRVRRDEARRALVEGEVSAALPCECQRCMEPVTMPVVARIALAVVANEEAAQLLPAELDPLLLPEDEGNVDLAALLEDELILALPQVPMHERMEDCGERVKYAKDTGVEAPAGETGRENPFAVLKNLKNRKSD